jgi:plasmid stabilization system protein ParE
MKTRFLDAAQSEFEETIAYYNEQRTGLGFEFADQVEQALARIRHYPEAWSLLSLRVRRCSLNRFPYSVIYESRSEVLIVVAIQHHHQKPGSWRTRVGRAESRETTDY